MAIDLKALTTRELDALGKRINNGTFGANYAPMSKDEKITHIHKTAATNFGTDWEAVVTQAALSIIHARDDDDKALVETEHHNVEQTSDAGSNPDLEGNEHDTGNAQPQQGDAERKGLDGSADGEAQRFNFGDQNQCNGKPQDGDVQGDAGADGAAGQAQGTGSGGSFPDLEARVSEIALEALLGPKAPAQQEENLTASILSIAQCVASDVCEQLMNQRYGTEEERQEAQEKVKQSLERICDKVEEKLAQAETALANVTVAPSIELTFPNTPTVSTQGRHPIYGKVAALLSLPAGIRQPLALVGPAGSGKSTIFEHYSEDTSLAFGATSCFADMTSGTTLGRVIPTGEGRYVPSELIRMAPNPGIYVLDEYDAAAGEIIVGLNAPLAACTRKEGGVIYVEAKSIAGESSAVRLHPDFRFGACLNTFGTGATAQYVARSQQDAASMDRWLILYMDDDEALWSSVSGKPYKPAKLWQPIAYSDDDLAEALAEAHRWLWAIKKRCLETGIKRIVSVRSMLRARACLSAGFSWKDTQDVLLAGWKDDEKAQVLA